MRRFHARLSFKTPTSHNMGQDCHVLIRGPLKAPVIQISVPVSGGGACPSRQVIQLLVSPGSQSGRVSVATVSVDSEEDLSGPEGSEVVWDRESGQIRWGDVWRYHGNGTCVQSQQGHLLGGGS